MRFIKNVFILFFLLTGTFSSCQPSEKSTSNQEKVTSYGQDKDDFSENNHRKHKKHRQKRGKSDENSKYTPENRAEDTQSDIRTGNVPTKALKVLKYVRENGVAMDGYVGGRRFGNYENLLPKKDVSGRKINYQEWDVNPKIRGKNRGAERLITGSDGEAYYTDDHYRSFVEVRN
ncbi:MAG: ribonuclease domain-containing protein [Arcicella sp.]|nr:ribonuclease domain-containing protein [Arcicella sp.]